MPGRPPPRRPVTNRAVFAGGRPRWDWGAGRHGADLRGADFARLVAPPTVEPSLPRRHAGGTAAYVTGRRTLGEGGEPGFVEVGEPALVAVDQVLWCPVLDDPAVLEHEYPVGDLDRRQPVRDDHRRSVREDRAQRMLHQPLRWYVE